MSSLRDMILKAVDCPQPEAVEVPEWGCTVYVAVMTAKDRDQWETEMAGNRDNVNIRASLLVRCLQDDQGKLIFSRQDADALGSKNAIVVDKLFDVAARINGIGSAAQEQAQKN